MRLEDVQVEKMTCPYCGVLSQMHWSKIHHNGYSTLFHSVQCTHCTKHSIWGYDSANRKAALLFPLESGAPLANSDMPPELLTLYKEAALVSIFSNRGAAAILRLCLQKICETLTGKTGTIADNLDRLRKSDDPIPDRFFKAAHAVRVIGNEAVHPGEIDFDGGDSGETVTGLFKLINALIDNQITQLNAIDSIIDKQPDKVKAKILKHQDQKTE